MKKQSWKIQLLVILMIMLILNLFQRAFYKYQIMKVNKVYMRICRYQIMKKNLMSKMFLGKVPHCPHCNCI